MQSIANVATKDNYDPQLTLDDPLATILSLIVANASAVARFRPARRETGGEESFGTDVLLTPQTQLIPNVSGVKFRSAIVGQPAAIIANLLRPDDPQIGAAIPFTQIVRASGAVGTLGMIDRNHSIVDATGLVEKTLYEATIPAGSIDVASVIRAKLAGDLLHNNVTGDNVRLRIYVGPAAAPTLILDTGAGVNSPLAQSGVGANRQHWALPIELTLLDSKTQQDVSMLLHLAGPATPAPTLGVGGFNAGLFGGAWANFGVGADMSGDTIVRVTALQSNASANNSFRKTDATLEVI